MARIESTMLALGTAAPVFDLVDVVSGRRLTLEDVRGERGLLVMFLSRHCPFVKHVEAELAAIGAEYPGQGIGIAAFGSNDAVHYPDDAPELLKAQAEGVGFEFPYLYDETQEVARAYAAVCTPDYFLFDRDMKLVYRGQLDDSRPGNGVPVTGRDMRGALDALVAGTPVSVEQKPSIGCSIKWKR